MHWDCQLKVGYFLSEDDGLQSRLDATASQLLSARYSLTVSRGRLKQHRGRSAGHHFALIRSSLPLFPISSIRLIVSITIKLFVVR